MLVQAKFKLTQSQNHQNWLDYFYVITLFTVKLDILSFTHYFLYTKNFHGHIKIDFLVTVKMICISKCLKLATIFTIDKFKILNKELQNTNLMSKTRITAPPGCAQNTLEAVTNHVFKYSHSITKQILHLENIKNYDIYLGTNFHWV